MQGGRQCGVLIETVQRPQVPGIEGGRDAHHGGGTIQQCTGVAVRVGAAGGVVLRGRGQVGEGGVPKGGYDDHGAGLIQPGEHAGRECFSVTPGQQLVYVVEPQDSTWRERAGRQYL